HADRALHAVFGAQLRIHPVDRILAGGEGRDGGNVRIERGVIDRVLQLRVAVVQSGLLEGAEADAVVEEAEAAADDGLLPPVLRASGRIGESDARGPVAMIAEQRLPFVAQAEAESEVGAHAPVVLNEWTRVPTHHADVRCAGLNAEAR